ncbi:MAG: protein phosphatase 2C domain-containing protein [Oscillospiraceae bacterium]|jgi:serine/threonine protein phosphatase PrpC|nr:protein phosphatase 2C domain-containing protein [Oscillospiraceae bacterium]
MSEAIKRPESIINGRYVIGTPAGTFEEKPRIAQQPGKMLHRSDWAADIALVNDLLVMGSSIRGAMHYGLSTIRQDAYAIGTEIDSNDNVWLIAAVADGVSSASQSHTIADYMARQAIVTVGDELKASSPNTLHSIEWSKVARRLVEISEEFCRNAAKRIVSTGNTDEVDKASVKDFIKKWATTLEFVVVQASGNDDLPKKEFVHVAVAGDGAAYVLNKVRGWVVIKSGKKQTGSIASNAVLSLPLSPDNFIINFGHLRKSDCFILTTDGLGDFIANGSTPLGAFFQRKLPKCESLASFMQITDVSLYQADDDRTIIMIKGA